MSLEKVEINYQPEIMINEKGKVLFDEKCKACHKLHYSDPDLLRNIDEKIPDRVKLRAFIRNSQQVIQSGDPYFIELYKAFNQTAMSSFPELSDQDIDDILEYIDQSYTVINNKTSSVAN
jgi:mono/diheme cytochrome c family protein